MIHGSVDLDGAVDPANEAVGGEETDGAGEYPEGEDDDESVTKVEQHGHKLSDLQLQPKQYTRQHQYPEDNHGFIHSYNPTRSWSAVKDRTHTAGRKGGRR